MAAIVVYGRCGLRKSKRTFASTSVAPVYLFDKRLSPAALDRLRTHDWPGNVRELRHVIEAAMIVSPDAEIQAVHLPASVRRTAAPMVGATSASLPTLEELERAHIELVLRTTNGHRGQAAAILGISERNLYRKLREYQMVPHGSDEGGDNGPN